MIDADGSQQWISTHYHYSGEVCESVRIMTHGCEADFWCIGYPLATTCGQLHGVLSMQNVSALRTPRVVPNDIVPVFSKYSIFVISAGFLLLPTSMRSPTSRSMVIFVSVLIVQLPIHRYLVRINTPCKAKRTYSLEA